MIMNSSKELDTIAAAKAHISDVYECVQRVLALARANLDTTLKAAKLTSEAGVETKKPNRGETPWRSNSAK